MNRRNFLMSSMAAAAVPSSIVLSSPRPLGAAPAAGGGVAVLLVDTERTMASIDKRIYGHFLEHVNHSVVDGLFAEQIRGCGFEGADFKTYWESFSDRGSVELAQVAFENGKNSVRLRAEGGRAGIRQGRLYIEAGQKYDGSLWVKREEGSPQLTLRVESSNGGPIASVPLALSGFGWQEVAYSFTSPARDTQASIEIAAADTGTLLVDFVSMMRADVRRDGALRPDLLQALQGLAPAFIRWPGGSFASTYKWKDGIGPRVSRRYHPNMVWGGYSDYYGFGTEEFLGLCRKLGAEPLVVLAATSTASEKVQYAMEWVHYLNDPPTTEWGKLRSSNGHPEPYGVRYFQIDNEPMNHGLTPEQYSEIVNVYGSRLRDISPQAQIVACGQKRSNDMDWSQKVIDVAGKNFDILGVHNYEYEPENFETGVRRIRDYLSKLRDYIRVSAHPKIEIAVLEWSLSRTYDWRAGLHAAGMLIHYEQLSPGLTMSCPALLMRNTTDDPTWTALIYHDHVSWFPGAAYPVEKLFREHYAERYLASTSGVSRDIPNRETFFTEIATMKPEDWVPGTVDAIATGSADGRRIVIKAVNYGAGRNDLLVRLQGAGVPTKAVATLHTLTAGLMATASLEHPDSIAPVSRPLNYAKDLTIDLEPYTVAVVEIQAE
ncbi:MAG TPA: alpha-L-arabinofuranosidase C-terminal domain-containing protein [Bryobacteraceae bacterium]|nr:alpha-L-arabinofuranosidase C-terminal domain-containing protein [Bryobacteraceae bacterium]